MIMPQVNARGLRLDDQGCRTNVVARADRAKFEQILLNLLSNAIKFTPSGGRIALSCETHGDGRVVVSVRDTGCGIPDGKHEAIFEPFVQVGRSLTSTREGAGLGLAISRDLARAMSGDITVESTLDVGSEFRLTLPGDHDGHPSSSH
jgi:signal transduction histidine kinase